MSARPPEASATVVLSDPDDELASVVDAVNRLVLEHPVAAQAAFAALVAEGRRFAATPEGRAWKDRLLGSRLVREGTLLWEGTGLTFLAEDDDRPLPSSFLDGMFEMILLGDVANRLARVLDLGR